MVTPRPSSGGRARQTNRRRRTHRGILPDTLDEAKDAFKRAFERMITAGAVELQRRSFASFRNSASHASAENVPQPLRW